MQVSKCQFLIAWVGYCGKPQTVAKGDLSIPPTPTSRFCSKHLGKTCQVCGEQAEGECAETLGAFVCGRLLCKSHKHVYPPESGYFGTHQ